MTALNPVVEALVRPAISIRRLMGNRLDIAVQFVCNDDPWLAELRDQPRHEALGSFGISTRLHENIKRIAVGIDRPLEPVLHPIDRDHNLVQMPFVIWSGTIPPDAGSKMRVKPVDPETDRFTAHYHATLGKQILDIRSAQRTPMARPDSVGDNLAWKTKALKRGMDVRNFMLQLVAKPYKANNLAMPLCPMVASHCAQATTPR